MTETITVDETSSLHSIIQLFGGTQQEQKNSLAKIDIDITDDFTRTYALITRTNFGKS